MQPQLFNFNGQPTLALIASLNTKGSRISENGWLRCANRTSINSMNCVIKALSAMPI